VGCCCCRLLLAPPPQTCESAFATRDRLRAHMVRHEEKVQCHVCSKLLSPSYIADHMHMHKQGGPLDGLCSICSKESCKHMGWSSPEKKHPCPQCGTLFKTKSHLNRHVQHVHLGKSKSSSSSSSSVVVGGGGGGGGGGVPGGSAGGVKSGG
uniref:Zinc finger protein 347-like n=1 Tax=Petromyzon marinus TaxID=7757 RepID=A0AAJ7SL80_PETMA